MSSESIDNREKDNRENRTRTRILDEALRILEERRGSGVRMADIARRAGISRQAVYLHFSSRTKLLEAATKHLDEKLNLENRLAPSRAATSGIERLELYVEFWGNYIPEIYNVAKALLPVLDSDEAAAHAWAERMAAMRNGCEAAVDALIADNKLAKQWSRGSATDVLWMMLSVSNWENLTIHCGWAHKKYIRHMKILTKRALTNE